MVEAAHTATDSRSNAGGWAHQNLSFGPAARAAGFLHLKSCGGRGGLEGKEEILPLQRCGNRKCPVPERMTQNFGGMGVEAAQPPEPPSGFNYTEHNRNSPSKVPKRSRGRYCGAWTMIEQRDGRYHHHRSRCKSYRCGLCGPRKIRRVRKSIVRHAVEHRLQRFLTLTLDPKKFPPGLDLNSKIRYLRDCWSKMRIYIRRKLGKSMQFIAVMELQGNGNPHLHALIGSFLDKRWITTAWQALGGGSFTRIEFADIHRVAAYVSKYISDDDALVDFPNGVRRFSTSRGLSLFERTKTDTTWELVRLPIDRLYRRASRIETENRSPEGELILFVAASPPYIYEPRWHKSSRWKEAVWTLQHHASAEGSL